VRKIQIEIHFKAGKNPIELPIGYNYILQSAIYNSISSELAEFLHNHGFLAGDRSFKMFCFSRLGGRFRLDRRNKRICFQERMKLIISSPIDEFCQSLVNTLLTRGFMRLGEVDTEIERMFAKRVNIKSEQVVMQTLSPVVVYSTFIKPEGGKFTCYFSPGEPDYCRLISDNLKRKYQALHKEEPPEGNVFIRRLGKYEMNITQYKNFIIKGYSGKFLLKGHPQLLQIAVDCGLGSKNSQGFGCMEVLEARGGEKCGKTEY
jgi:CRISPR-associated endoribonuclease Cas6